VQDMRAGAQHETQPLAFRNTEEDGSVACTDDSAHEFTALPQCAFNGHKSQCTLRSITMVGSLT
jgi:hypothetical protein